MNTVKIESDYVDGHWLPRTLLLLPIFLWIVAMLIPQESRENIIGNILGIGEITEEALVGTVLIFLIVMMIPLFCVGIYMLKHGINIFKHKRYPPPSMLQPFRVKIYSGFRAKFAGALFLWGAICCFIPPLYSLVIWLL